MILLDPERLHPTYSAKARNDLRSLRESEAVSGEGLLDPDRMAILEHAAREREHLARTHAGRVVDFIARDGERPVGACTLMIGEHAVGFHDVGVLEAERGRGIGSALMAFALEYARSHAGRATHATLIASGMGSRMYQRVGFREVCAVGYWYRARGA